MPILTYRPFYHSPDGPASVDWLDVKLGRVWTVFIKAHSQRCPQHPSEPLWHYRAHRFCKGDDGHFVTS